MGSIRIKSGITLVEILVVTALIGLIAVVFTVFSFSRKSEKSIASKNDTLYTLKKTMSILESNLSNISNIIEIEENGIIARLNNGKRISFYIDGNQDLIMASLKGIDEKVIAKEISEFEIKPVSLNKMMLLKFMIKIGDNDDYTAKDSVLLRYYR